MKRMLFNATYAEELRVASVDGQKLINFDIETSSKEQRRGNIYKGFITRVEPSLEACFVDYGTEKQGFLPFKEIDFKYLSEVNGQRGREFSKLPVGTELIVQVEKDERGNKGAALTSYVSLPGRYLVLMPNNSRAGGISRRIEGEERDELKSLMSQLDIPQGMSIILRTAALGRVVEELQWDLTYLLKLWEAIGSAANDQKGSFLIYQESSLVIRSIRDHFSPDICEVLIDTEDVYNQARQFMAHVMPNFADRIKFYRDDVPLFSRFQIEHQIESAYSRGVNLPSGGSIVIDHTEALTAVDVNSARANKGADIETTAFLTNLEAAEEIARQLRLRDLGGLVVVDFIDMENPRNQRDLENHFKNQLGYDRARIQMSKLSKFGLLELSRQRLQASLDESTTISCPRCAGVGSIRGIESSALHVLRIVQEDVIKNGSHLSAFHVQLPVDVATYLLNERRDDVAKLEARMKVRIVLVPNVHLDSPNYKIKKLTYDNYDSNFSRSSYDLVEVPEETVNYKAATQKPESQASKVPLVSNISVDAPAPNVDKRPSKSLFGGLVKKIGEFFASKPSTIEDKNAKKPPHRSGNVGRNLKTRDNNGVRNERNPRNSSERNERAPNSPISSANKTRPVPIARTNDKLHTVRPNQSNFAKAAPSVEDSTSPAVAPAPRNENKDRVNPQAPRRNNQQRARNVDGSSQSQPQNRRNDNNSNSQAPTATTNTSVAAPTPQQRKPSRTSAELTFIPQEDRVNVADSSTQQTIFVASSSGSAVAMLINEVNPVVSARAEKAISPVAPAIKVVPSVTLEEKKPIQQEIKAPVVAKPIRVYVPEVVDLGELKMVATDTQLLNSPAPKAELPKVTRLSDVKVEEKIVDLNIVYELVETKN